LQRQTFDLEGISNNIGSRIIDVVFLLSPVFVICKGNKHRDNQTKQTPLKGKDTQPDFPYPF